MYKKIRNRKIELKKKIILFIYNIVIGISFSLVIIDMGFKLDTKMFPNSRDMHSATSVILKEFSMNTNTRS